MKRLASVCGTGRSLRRVILALSSLLVAADLAHAQPPDRRGFVFEVSAGVGGMVRGNAVAEDPSVAILHDAGSDLLNIGFDVQFGWRVARKVAVIGIISFDFGEEPGVGIPVALQTPDATITMVSDDHYMFSAVFVGGVQYWPAGRFWVRGGIGIGDLERDFDQTDRNLSVTFSKTNNFAVLGAAGMEIFRSGSFGVDLQVRYSTYSVQGMRVQNIVGLVGLSYF